MGGPLDFLARLPPSKLAVTSEAAASAMLNDHVSCLASNAAAFTDQPDRAEAQGGGGSCSKGGDGEVRGSAAELQDSFAEVQIILHELTSEGLFFQRDWQHVFQLTGVSS